MTPRARAGRASAARLAPTARRSLMAVIAVSCTAVVLFGASACKDVVGPTVALNERFALAPGETGQLKADDAFVTFVRVDGDSRCPADAICIQGGDARVVIDVKGGGAAARYELHTGDGRPVVHRQFTISLIELSPYPFSSRPTKPSEYRATLLVTR